jgi:DNA sulfur modification protein DndB
MAADSRDEMIRLRGTIGASVSRRVFLGFAPARVLAALSFADVLDEDTGVGYQRRFNSGHSQDFRRYVQEDGSSTIPLTFNLRPTTDEGWKLIETDDGISILDVRPSAGKVMARVDCQHRLGYLGDLDVSLPFMCFIGLSVREEMEIFKVINGKAKGLSTSILDFHDASMSSGLWQDRPELYISLQLHSVAESPWCKQLDLGGRATSGLRRRASLRTMQKAVKRFLNQTKLYKMESGTTSAEVVISFWAALALVLPTEWNSPRAYLVNKGIGVYALMTIAADIYSESNGQTCDRKYFVGKLSEFLTLVDWGQNGPLKGLGGEGGVSAAVAIIRRARANRGLKVVNG